VGNIAKRFSAHVKLWCNKSHD